MDEENEGDDDVPQPGDAVSAGLAPRVPPFLERRMLLGDMMRRLPLEPLLQGVSAPQSLGEDRLFHMRDNEFGDGIPWSVGGVPEHRSGKMYFTDPGDGSATWKRTAEQAHAVVTCLTRESLRSSVISSKLSHGTAVLFLLDAAMRIAANRHTNHTAVRKKRLGRVFTQIPKGDAYIFDEGPITHARGPTAAVLRSSYGSLAYWPDMRVVLDAPSRKAVRYAAAAMLRAEVYLASRTGPDQTNLSDDELAAVSACLTSGVMAACVAAQFLYVALGRAFHPGASNEEYARVVNPEPLVRYPMGSDELLRVEGACLGRVEAGRHHPSSITRVVVAAYVAARSALTEIMNEFTEGYDGPWDGDDRYGPSPGPEVASAIIAAAMVLQRLMGHMNVLATRLVIAALYHGRSVETWSETFKIYAAIAEICAPLYRPVTAGELDDDVNKAYKDVSVSPARGSPPRDERETIEIPELSELDVLRLSPPRDDYDVVGRLVPLSQAVEGAREVIFGLDAVEMTRAHITGGRAIGSRGRR
uniref:Tegument protein UL47 n=1 Tax=Anatid alphaherpesvirus 2 TaxID=3080522 RepID=A0AAU0K713_9ALPH